MFGAEILIPLKKDKNSSSPSLPFKVLLPDSLTIGNANSSTSKVIPSMASFTRKPEK